MNPKPLDLEDIEEWIKERIKHYEEMRRKTRGSTKEIIFEGKRDTAIRFETKFKIIKQRIKQACEFFLKYWDRPAMFLQDFPKFKEKFVKMKFMTKEGEFTANIYDEYVEWLFRLAFKDVFGDEK